MVGLSKKSYRKSERCVQNVKIKLTEHSKQEVLVLTVKGIPAWQVSLTGGECVVCHMLQNLIIIAVLHILIVFTFEALLFQS